MKSFFTAWVAGLLAIESLSAAIELQNGLVAVVNDAVITYQELREITIRSEEALYRLYGNKPERYVSEIRKVREDGLESLIERQLILQDFKNSGFAIPESFIEDQIKVRIREQFTDRVNLTKELQAKGITYETYRQRVRDEIVVMLMRQRNIGAGVLISPAKIERYYQANLTNYNVGDQVKLRVIVLNAPTAKSSPAVQRLAREIVQKIDTGISFKEMASVYSEGSARQEGGDWGWRDRTFLKKGLSDVVFTIKAGERSSIIGMGREADDSYWLCQYDSQGVLTAARKYSADEGKVEEQKLAGAPEAAKKVPEPQEYYLILVEDKRPAHVRPLANVQDEIEKELISKERARLQKKWIDRLRAKSFVRYYM